MLYNYFKVTIQNEKESLPVNEYLNATIIFSCPSNGLCSPPGTILLLVQKKYQEKDTRGCRPWGLPCAARQ